jgi:hypothetical protein
MLNFKIDLMIKLLGNESPLPKNWHFKAEGLNIGWVGKIKKNR